MAEAEAALGRLAALGELLPSPDLLARPYVLREALSSTRIEGTQATLPEIFEIAAAGVEPNADVEEVLNHVEALEWGAAQLRDLPLGSRLLRGIHRRLTGGVRGRARTPGELRTSQNWIGPPGSTIETASFVPPPPEEVPDLITDWERFAHERAEVPLLIQNALLHSRFETIHPFLDGNGRLGRLLLVLFLIDRGRLDAPLLYLSAYLDQHRLRYYEALQAVEREGNATPWFELFLEAVETQASDAVARARRIIDLRERYREAAATMATPNGLAVVELLFSNPLVTTKLVEDRLGVSRPTALRLLSGLAERGVLSATTGGARGQRRYVAKELMEALAEADQGARS